MRKSAPEFLLIDAGNTRLKWALARGAPPKRVAGEVATREVTGAWMRELARNYARHRVVLACVVPRLITLFRRAFGERLLVADARTAAKSRSVEFLYPNPGELGADRIAAAVAARASGCFPSIVVACGTATAFTVLDAQGRLCGGAIAPGLHAQLTAVLGATAQLPATHLRKPKSVLAKSTGDAIRAGVILSYQGGVKEIVRQLTKSLPPRPKPHLILTGGDAELVAGVLGPGVKVRPLLVFEGLLIIGSRLGMPAP